MRKEVQALIKLGPMPPEDMVDKDTVYKYENLLHKIQPPLTIIEAEGLASLFGPDSFYGLAWTLVSLIESAPDWPKRVRLPDSGNEWIQLLRSRAAS